ncbi:MAG: cadherin-like domain-containing protein, partial [Novipirellula sp. JB048]
DLASTQRETIPVGSDLSKLQPLGDGTLLVLGGETSEHSAWIVDPVAKTADAIELAPTEPAQRWADVAIDANGRGVLIGSSHDPVFVHAVDASDPERGVVVATTTTQVPADTTVIASESGPRSVLAWAGETGLKLSLWSNETASLITPQPIEVAGVNRLLAFDDASGLLVLRQHDGGVSVLDANADFAALHSFAEMTGPVTLDGARELLTTIFQPPSPPESPSPPASQLRVVDLRDGAEIANRVVDLSTIGEIISIDRWGEPSALTVLGSAGVMEVSLHRAAAHHVKIVDHQDAEPIRFAVRLDGDNTAPSYSELPTLTTAEDNVLLIAAPGLYSGVVDEQGDRFVVLQKSGAAHGVVNVGVDGALSYTPNRDFYGHDSVSVTLHDGVSQSDPVELSITVLPVVDEPPEVVIQLDPVAESLPLGEPVGLIEVIGAGGLTHHVIEIDDPRFIIDEHQMILFIGGIDGQGLDYETEPQIPLTVTVTDSATGTELVSQATLTITDANDPITGIVPTVATVSENVVGDTIAELFVIDQDTEQFHILTVDDERFVIDGSDLRLADGVSLNYEETPEVVVNVTATEWGVEGAIPFTQAITIVVLDLSEQPETLGLAGDTIEEFKVGAEVGAITLDGQPASDRFVLTVDDTRFEVAAGILKLAADQVVKRATQSEIQLTLTATDSHHRFDSLSSTFVIGVLENAKPFHNHENPYDVDYGGTVTVADALLIINYLNVYAPGPVGPGNPAYGYDVNGDGLVTALDALLILNEINRSGSGGDTVGGGEQEEIQPDGEQILPAAIPQIADGGHENGGHEQRIEPWGLRENDRAIVETVNEARQRGFDVTALGEPLERDLLADLSDGIPDGPATPNATAEVTEELDETIRLLSDPTA